MFEGGSQLLVVVLELGQQSLVLVEKLFRLKQEGQFAAVELEFALVLGNLLILLS